MRRERSFLILLVLGIAFGAYIYFVERNRPAGDEAEKKPKVFENVQESEVEEILVSSGDSKTRLKKTGGKWQIVEPIATDADVEQVNNLLGNFATLERNEVVDENPADVKPFGLSPPRADVAFRKQGSKDLRHLLVGSKAPTGGDLYAQVQGEKRVILISGFMENVFVRSTFDLRDKSVLKFERDKVEGLELQPAGGPLLRLSRASSEWRIVEPRQVRADFGSAEALVGHLGNAQMRALVSSETPTGAALKQYGFERPAVIATVVAGSARASLEIGAATQSGTFYARDPSRPLVFTVDGTLVDDLKKRTPDFRRKDVFDFRPFNATHLEITQGSTTYAFDKVKKNDPKSPMTDVWRQKSPARDIAIEKMDSFLSGFSNLRAESWADRVPAGAPALTFAVTYEESGKQERVVFLRQGSDVYATRTDEPGAAKVSATDYDTAARALDAVLK